MPPFHLHLVRHGQSTWNVEGRLQGQAAHPELTDLGRIQARSAADVLRERVTGTVTIVSSDLLRARQTADIIASALEVVVVHDPDLREQSLGDLEGRLASELTAQPVPDGCDVSEVRWGGGESLQDVHRRLARPIARAHSSDHDHLVWVTHGDTMRVALARLAGRSHRAVEWDPIVNGAVVSMPLARP